MKVNDHFVNLLNRQRFLAIDQHTSIHKHLHTENFVNLLFYFKKGLDYWFKWNSRFKYMEC